MYSRTINTGNATITSPKPRIHCDPEDRGSNNVSVINARVNTSNLTKYLKYGIPNSRDQHRCFMLGTVLIVILILLLIGAIPRWNYNRQWGYAPFGGLMTLFIIILILWLLGVIH